MVMPDSSAETPHPSPADLRAFGLGLLTVADFETIAEHLGDCPDCERKATAIQSDGFVNLVKRAAASTPAAAAVPPRIAPGYETLQELGRGGMGVVFLARQPGLGRLVALKQLRSGRLASPEELMRFRREAKALARLDHPNIVRVYDSGEQDNIPYLALEYVPGTTLAARLKEGPIELRAGLQLLLAVTRGVEYSHRAGILHRDLKPGNILLQANPDDPEGPGTPRITDFGLARPIDLASETLSGTLIGTPAYMAPELINGTAGGGSPAADIFSLGAILYELLTGRPPFRGQNVVETFDLVRMMTPIPPRKMTPSIPREVESICLHCLEKSPASRYATAAELAQDLEQFLRGESLNLPRSRFSDSLWRRSSFAVMVIGGLIAATGFGGLAAWQNGDWQPQLSQFMKSPNLTQAIELPGLQLWLRADKGIELDNVGRVRHWADQSSRKTHNASQLIGDYRPTLTQPESHSFPRLHFDGEDDSLDVAGPLLESQEFTVVAVANYEIGNVGSHVLLSNWDAVKSRDSVFLGVMDHEGVSPRFTDEIGGLTDENFQLTRRALIPQPGRLFLITARSSAANAEVFINSTRLISADRPLARRDLSGVWRIGTQGAAWEFWKGDLAELAVYDRALSDAELNQVWKSLRARHPPDRPN